MNREEVLVMDYNSAGVVDSVVVVGTKHSRSAFECLLNTIIT